MNKVHIVHVSWTWTSNFILDLKLVTDQLDNPALNIKYKRDPAYLSLSHFSLSLFRATHPSATSSSSSSSSPLSSPSLLWCGSLWVQPFKTSVKLFWEKYGGLVLNSCHNMKRIIEKNTFAQLFRKYDMLFFSHFEAVSSKWSKGDKKEELNEKKGCKWVKPPRLYKWNHTHLSIIQHVNNKICMKKTNSPKEK